VRSGLTLGSPNPIGRACRSWRTAVPRPPKRSPRPHDPVYRRIFTHARTIEDILRRFATGPWAAKLDFKTLELIPGRYVSRFLEQRESDVVWRVRYGTGPEDWFYVFVLMELQSTVQRFMALRLWVYVALLYQHLVKQRELTPTGLLPPVLPVVLYNGEAPWTAPQTLQELIQPLEGFFRPAFKYVVLDVGHYPVEELRPIEDVVSGVFLMEQAADFSDLRDVVEEVQAIIDDPELEEDLALLMSSVIGKLADKDEETPRLTTFQEVHMLLERVERWPQKWRQEGLDEGLKKGRKQGREQGRKQGLRQGKADLLKSQASQRFGELSPEDAKRFDRADVDTLDRWGRRLLEATTLEDVFEDGPG